MARLIYTAITSLDGYIEDENGNFNWGAPDEEVHQFVNDLERTARTHLYGRKLYETMMVWETDPGFTEDSAILQDFAQIWQAADKIVYSNTLLSVPTRKTQLVRNFDPQAVRQLKQNLNHDLLIGGAEIAAHAFAAGLVDEVQLFIMPVSLGGGKPCLPENIRLDLELLEERRFASGTIFLRYQTKPTKSENE